MRLIFWLMFAVMMGVYMTMVLWSGPKLMADAGGLMMFDMRPAGYSLAEAQAFMAALSDEGRAFYLNVQQMLDSAYPALFAVVMVMAFSSLFTGLPRWVAMALALAGAGFDYMENAAVAVMLRAGDGLNEAMVASASQWTVLKSGAVTLALLMLIAGLVMAWMARRKAMS
ncbi:hypothetical protein [Profundibacter sp.]